MARHSKGRLFSSHSRGALNARLRRIIIFSSLTFVACIILVIVGYSQLMSYLQGNDFRQLMASHIKAASGASEVNIASNFNINGSRVSTEGVEVVGLRNISNASASRISLELNRNALLSRKLHVRKLSMEEASLALNSGVAARSSTPTRKGKARKSTKKRSAPAEAKKGSLSTFKLQGIELEQLECRDADLHLTHNGKVFQLLGANITASPAPRIGSGAWQMSAENARFHTPFSFLRDSSIKSATAVYQNNKVDMTECRIMLTPGEMRVKAHYDVKAGNWSADLQVNKGDLHRVLNEDWKKRVTGDLYGRLQMTGANGGVSTAAGSFSVQDAILEGLPFLSQIPVGNSYPYRSIELEKADCQVLFPYRGEKIQQAWLFDKINIRSRDGSFLVKGHVLIGTDRRLGGTLRIGLPKSIAAAFPLSQEELADKLFSAVGDDDALLWVNMNLSGTIDHPQEDLSIRIATLAGQGLSKFLKEIPKGKASDLLNTLLKQKPVEPKKDEAAAPQPATESPGDLIQDAADAAGSLIQSLF